LMPLVETPIVEPMALPHVERRVRNI
jgi:hypothetical protein